MVIVTVPSFETVTLTLNDSELGIVICTTWVLYLSLTDLTLVVVVATAGVFCF